MGCYGADATSFAKINGQVRKHLDWMKTDEIPGQIWRPALHYYFRTYLALSSFNLTSVTFDKEYPHLRRPLITSFPIMEDRYLSSPDRSLPRFRVPPVTGSSIEGVSACELTALLVYIH